MCIAVLYVTIGLKFSFSPRRQKYLIRSFVIGLVIGILGGFVALYNLKISRGKVILDIEFSRWLSGTGIAVLLGALLSLFIYSIMKKK